MIWDQIWIRSRNGTLKTLWDYNVCLLFNGISNFLGYLMPNPSFFRRTVVVLLFKPLMGGIGGAYFSQGYLSESERNSATGVRTHDYDSAAQRFNHRDTTLRFWVSNELLHSRDTTIRIHIHAETKSTIMTNEHTSLEKYTSHILFSKGLRKGCMWEVSWRLNRLQYIDPKFLW